MTRIWVIAGEASGDIIGGRLMLALRAAAPDCRIEGIGGQQMQAAGLASLFPMEELSLMGLLEILPHLPRLRRRLRETVQAILAAAPDVVVTIDSPGFCFQVAKALHCARTAGAWHGKLVHYVAPSVWAWKPKRAEKIARLYDQLLCLLPFEPPYFTRHGLPAAFVGHPILETGIADVNPVGFLQRHALKPATALLLLPGSRRTEVKRLLPIFLETAQRLGSPPLLLPTLPHLEAAIRAATTAYAAPVIITTDSTDKYAAMRAANKALAASGTVSLELAMAGTPMVIAYRVNPLTAAIARRLIRIPYASLINILADQPLIPEYLQERCTPHNLANALATLAPQAERLQPYLAQLHNANGVAPSVHAAKIVLNLVLKI